MGQRPGRCRLSASSGEGWRGKAPAAFEVSVRGIWHGEPFTQALCLVFVIAQGRVREFREYLAWPGGLAEA